MKNHVLQKPFPQQCENTLPPKKKPHHNDAGMVLGKGFVQVAVRSCIVAGTVFEDIF
jgi:hypothetical protein